MADYGEAAVAGMAIVARIMPVAVGVIFALSGAIGPIMGQNFGAGQQDRVDGFGHRRHLRGFWTGPLPKGGPRLARIR